MTAEAGQMQALIASRYVFFYGKLYHLRHTDPLLTYNFMYCFLIYLK